MCNRTAYFKQYQLARSPAKEPTWAMKSKVLKEFVVNNTVNCKRLCILYTMMLYDEWFH
jgi:hypothetical protein